MTIINHSESIDELSELKVKLEEDISRTRSNDKGEQNGKIFTDICARIPCL
jgi:hypothetical protein